MNTKRRCTFCKDFYEADSRDARQVGLSGVCSTGCLNDLKDRARNKRSRRAEHRANRIRYGRRLDPSIRQLVRERDRHMCRYCGVSGDMLQIHHINYRSQGGPDEVWNLILLCDAHHRLMHTSKRHWQPILRSVQAVYYFSNVRMSVRSAEKKLAWMAAGEPPDDGPDDAPE